MPTTRHHGKLSQNSTYTREETIDSTQYKRKTTKTTPIIGESKSDSDKSKTKLESSTHVRRETVGTTQFNNTITRIILESMVDEKNQSKLETASVTEDVIVLRNVSPKSTIFKSIYMFTHSFFFICMAFELHRLSSFLVKETKIYREQMHVM